MKLKQIAVLFEIFYVEKKRNEENVDSVLL